MAARGPPDPRRASAPQGCSSPPPCQRSAAPPAAWPYDHHGDHAHYVGPDVYQFWNFYINPSPFWPV